jgi:thiamine pyrophosphate-dependent acetolactate synthase large subunit-like protein
MTCRQLTFQMVALSMADGYARLTGKPQCVIVHVDVGTQGLGAAVHNASCGRAPVLIFAGLSPFTIEGEMRGSRTEYIHWIQDVPDQKQIVAQYCRYTGEIKSGKNVKVRGGKQEEVMKLTHHSKWSIAPCPLP